VGGSGVSVGGGDVGLGGSDVSVGGGGVSVSGAGVGLAGSGVAVDWRGVGDGSAATSETVVGTTVVVGTLHNVNAAVTIPKTTSQTTSLTILAVIYKSSLVLKTRG
jgi:hypothetical protein